MYTLRKVSNDGRESNIYLGNRYTTVGRKETPIEFERILKDIFEGLNDDKVYMFLCTEDGGEFIPLYTDQWNYIMTESGKTFSNLSRIK